MPKADMATISPFLLLTNLILPGVVGKYVTTRKFTVFIYVPYLSSLSPSLTLTIIIIFTVIISITIFHLHLYYHHLYNNFFTII